MQQRQRVVQLSKVPLFANCSKPRAVAAADAGTDRDGRRRTHPVRRGGSVLEPVRDRERHHGGQAQRTADRAGGARRCRRRAGRDPGWATDSHRARRNTDRMAGARSSVAAHRDRRGTRPRLASPAVRRRPARPSEQADKQPVRPRLIRPPTQVRGSGRRSLRSSGGDHPMVERGQRRGSE